MRRFRYGAMNGNHTCVGSCQSEPERETEKKSHATKAQRMKMKEERERQKERHHGKAARPKEKEAKRVDPAGVVEDPTSSESAHSMNRAKANSLPVVLGAHGAQGPFQDPLRPSGVPGCPSFTRARAKEE